METTVVGFPEKLRDGIITLAIFLSYLIMSMSLGLPGNNPLFISSTFFIT
jgi:hypothetical protein